MKQDSTTSRSRVHSLLLSGLRPREVSNLIGRTIQSVNDMCRRHHLPTNRPLTKKREACIREALAIYPFSDVCWMYQQAPVRLAHLLPADRSQRDDNPPLL